MLVTEGALFCFRYPNLLVVVKPNARIGCEQYTRLPVLPQAEDKVDFKPAGQSCLASFLRR